MGDLSSLSPAGAAALAARLLGTVGTRLAHSAAVARSAERASRTVHGADLELLVEAAWLHDIGYAAVAAETGFHPLDGARFLERRGTDRRLVNLVANHSYARFEAEKRDLLPELDQYHPEVGPVADALVYADMTTGPTGAAVTVEERLYEILCRYKPDNPVHRAIADASGEIEAAVSRVERRLALLL